MKIRNDEPDRSTARKPRATRAERRPDEKSSFQKILERADPRDRKRPLCSAETSRTQREALTPREAASAIRGEVSLPAAELVGRGRALRRRDDARSFEHHRTTQEFHDRLDTFRDRGARHRAEASDRDPQGGARLRGAEDDAARPLPRRDDDDPARELGVGAERLSARSAPAQPPLDAPAAERAAQARASARMSALCEQLVRAVHVAEQRDQKLVVLELEVADRGRVDVRIARDGAGYRVRMRSDDAGLRHALRAHAPAFREQARRKGLVFAHLEVI